MDAAKLIHPHLGVGRTRGRPASHLGRIAVATAVVALAAAGWTAVMPPTTEASTPVDWTQFRESQTHQGNNPETGTVLSAASVGGMTLAWHGAAGKVMDSSPAMTGSVVYIGSSDGNLYAFPSECASGGALCPPTWKGATGGAITSSPAVAGGYVFVGSADGKLYAFKVGCGTGGATCAPSWTATTGDAIDSSPAVDKGVIYIGSNDGKLYAFSTSSAACTGTPKVCTPIWKATIGSAIHSSPAESNGFIYVGADDGKMYVFSATCSSGGGSCSPLWTAVTGGPVRSSPSISSGHAYIGSNDGKFYAFDAAGLTSCTGTPKVCNPLWTATTGGAVTASAAEGLGRVWIASADGKVYSFSGCATTGGTCTPQWTVNIGHPISSSPAYSDGVLYIGASDGKVYALKADCATATCAPLWSATVGTEVKSSPTVTTGFVYVGSDNGVSAFNLPIDHLVLSPATATIAAGAFQTYKAEGFSATNFDMGDVTLVTTFTISGTGTCSGAGCGASSAGTYTVTGHAGNATGTASLTVTVSGSSFHPLNPPARIVDSRIKLGLAAKLKANNPATFTVVGKGGVPTGATAVTGNLTAVNQTFAWAVYLGPTPIANPTTSTINFGTGQVTANGVTVALSPTGTLSATYMSTSGNTMDLVFDVTGYFTADSTGDTFHPMKPPVRSLDTRFGNGLSGTLKANKGVTWQVTGRNGIPATAKAVTGNVTVTDETDAWAVYVGPVQLDNPTTSSVNFLVGDVRANNVTVALSATGTLSATYISHAGQTTNLVFDVTGYFTADMSGSTYVPVSPVRLLDSRYGNGLSGKFNANTSRSFVVGGRGGVTSAATGVTGNLTVVNETFAWAAYIGPNQQNAPTTSTLNFVKGDIRSNGLTASLGGGSLWATYISNPGNTADLVFDLTGYYTP